MDGDTQALWDRLLDEQLLLLSVYLEAVALEPGGAGLAGIRRLLADTSAEVELARCLLFKSRQE